ncbi:MAG: hypothetical protein STHCBS139747_006941 [Sporothrix thermara]
MYADNPKGVSSSLVYGDVAAMFLFQGLYLAVYWVETKGKTLEEIDALFEGEKHSDVPDVEEVPCGAKTLDVAAVEKQLTTKLGDIKGNAE